MNELMKFKKCKTITEMNIRLNAPFLNHQTFRPRVGDAFQPVVSTTVPFLNPGNKPINPGSFFSSQTLVKAQSDYIQIYLTPTH